MSAVFILMVIRHLLVVMYNNTWDDSISFEETTLLMKPMQGNQWVNCVFLDVCF